MQNLQIEPPLGMGDHTWLFLKNYATLLKVIRHNTKFCGIKVTIVV